MPNNTVDEQSDIYIHVVCLARYQSGHLQWLKITVTH